MCCFLGTISTYCKTTGERKGVFGARPTFEIKDEYIYYLAPNDPGVDARDRIPNFNNRYDGDASDIGAFERGVFPPAEMR